jgi:hypothetical protein
MMANINEQPDPIPNETPSVWDLVLADMKDRDAYGRRKYGTPLQVANGRDMLYDLYSELLDACCYIRGEIYRRDGK